MLFYSPSTEITAYAVSRFVNRIRGDSPVQRRLEDKIKALAEHAVTVQDPEELGDVIEELRGALHEHTQRLRKLAAQQLAPVSGRRSRDYEQ
jgi:hypothetical protein